MPSYSASVSISAPRESVWSVLAAVVAWPEWLPTVSSIQPMDGNPLAIGSRYKVVQPKLRPVTWTVTELEPPRRFTWQARSPGLLMVADHSIDVSSPTSSQVLLSFSFEGLLGAPVGWLFRSVTASYLAQEAAALKRRVEGER